MTGARAGGFRGPAELPARHLDGRIAAIAKVNELILVTRNTGDFVEFVDLEVQNWFS